MFYPALCWKISELEFQRRHFKTSVTFEGGEGVPYYIVLENRIAFMRIYIWLITMMQIRMRNRIYIFIWCGSGSGFLYDADSDPTFHPDAEPDPIPSFQIKALLKRCSNRLIFNTFWLVICKLMRKSYFPRWKPLKNRVFPEEKSQELCEFPIKAAKI